MSAHPAPRAARAIRAETAGSSGLALGPNQRGKGGGEVEASISVMAMAHRRTRGRVRRRAWRNLAAAAVSDATRLANPVTFCDGHLVFFVAASGQILMAADSGSPPTSGQMILCQDDWDEARMRQINWDCARSTGTGHRANSLAEKRSVQTQLYIM